jgi:hypothetical protein
MEDEGQVPSLGEAEEEKKVVMEIGEEIEIPMEEEIREVTSSNRLYPDIFQRNEMLTQLIRSLPQIDQRNIVKLQSLRRLVEMMIVLRNEVVEYGVTNEPIGAKSTSRQTIAELLENNDVNMSRKVANMKKVIYADKYKSRENPPEGDLEDAEDLRVEYLDDILGEAEMLRKREGMESSGEGMGMPKTYQDLELYRRKIQQPYLTSGKAIRMDEEVFRSEIPGEEEVNCLDDLVKANRAIKKSDINKIKVFNPPPVTKCESSVVRLLTSRKVQKDRMVEPAEGVDYKNILLFPLTTEREIGTIRTGSLGKDVSLSMSHRKLMDDILEEYGQVSDFPTADKILNIGLNGILGNVNVSDWLKSQPIVINGVGDVYEKLKGYGLLDIELNKEQSQVIQEKLEEHLAKLKIFMNRQREENETALKNLKFTSETILDEASAARLLTRVESEPLLQKVLEEVRSYMGELSKVDSLWFTYVFVKYPDLTLAVLGKQADLVAREKVRHIRDQLLNSVREGYRLKMKLKEGGERPTINKCPHVESLEGVRKIGQVKSDEPRDTVTMKAMLKFLSKFRGETKNDWVWCNTCNEHLICGHELLQLQEYQRPREKDVIHKEILLKFSGGVFGGKYICKVCGQHIAELDFDTNIEFDDEGRPMMGRAVMVDEDAERENEMKILLSGAPIQGEEVKEVGFGNDEMNEMYKTLKTIMNLMGVNPEEEDYRGMIDQFSSYMKKIPNPKVYEYMTKGKTALDYEIFRAVEYTTIAAAIALLNIQTHIPEYVIYYTNADCKDGFLGYPLEGVESSSGINCVTSVVAGINENVYPWNSTTLQRLADINKRRERIAKSVFTKVDKLSKDPVYQAALHKKREYRMNLYGVIGESKKEIVPKNFRPEMFVLSEKEAAKGLINVGSANDEKKAIGWIRQAHGYARETSALNPNAPISETTCCLHNLEEPNTFWREKSLPELEDRKTIDQKYRSSTLGTTFYTEQEKMLKGTIEASEYYKLFSKFCYDGDNKGLPHKLGITLTCSECGLNFKRNPNLPLEVTKKDDITKVIQEQKAHIETQGVIINEDTFMDLLNTIHLKSKVERDTIPHIPRGDTTFLQLVGIGIVPIENMGALLSEIQTSLTQIGANPTRVQVATASENFYKAIEQKEIYIQKRLGPDIFRYITSITEGTPRECGEHILTYLVVPFQRWLAQINQDSFKVLDTYELSNETKDDIMKKGLGAHLQLINTGGPLKGLLKRKVKFFIKEMSLYSKEVFPKIRSMTTPGGQTMITYLLRAYVMGPIQRLLNTAHIPEGDEDISGPVDIKVLYKGLAQAMTKYAKGSRIPNEEEIKLGLEKRAEAERMDFVKKQETMTKDMKQIDLLNKSLGLGDYSMGGTKSIRFYDPEQYERDREQRARVGISDYEDLNKDKAYDMFGFSMGLDEEVGVGNEYDQIAEDDY